MQTNNPQSVNAMAIPNMTTSVVPVNMDEQVSFIFYNCKTGKKMQNLIYNFRSAKN